MDSDQQVAQPNLICTEVLLTNTMSLNNKRVPANEKPGEELDHRPFGHSNGHERGCAEMIPIVNRG